MSTRMVSRPRLAVDAARLVAVVAAARTPRPLPAVPPATEASRPLAALLARHLPRLLLITLLVATAAALTACATDDDLSSRTSSVEDTRCFVAYVHGRGDDHTPGVGTDAREYWRTSPDDTNG